MPLVGGGRSGPDWRQCPSLLTGVHCITPASRSGRWCGNVHRRALRGASISARHARVTGPPEASKLPGPSTREPQLLKPAQLEPALCCKRSRCCEKPTYHNGRKAHMQQ
ncbi:hypothetical protein AB1E18_004576 [Capra hircus]